MPDSRRINTLTWKLESLREQIKFTRRDLDNLQRLGRYEEIPLFKLLVKRFHTGEHLLLVGVENYRKVLRSGQLNEACLGRILTLYIKRARVNLELAWSDLTSLLSPPFPKDPALRGWGGKLRTALRVAADVEREFSALLLA